MVHFACACLFASINTSDFVQIARLPCHLCLWNNVLESTSAQLLFLIGIAQIEFTYNKIENAFSVDRSSKDSNCTATQPLHVLK